MDRDDEIRLSVGRGEEVRLDILVENLGRVNYGAQMGERKGLTGVRIGNAYHSGWTMYPFELTDLSSLEYTGYQEGQPAFFAGSFSVEGERCDTFLRTEGFSKGNVFVNGFNLGRYWNERGPQRTLCSGTAVKRRPE